MANPSRFLLTNHLDEDSVNSSSDEDSVKSSSSEDSSVESLSDEATSSDDSISTVTSQVLTKAKCGDDGVVARDGDEDQDDDDTGDEDCCYDDEDLDDELIERSVRKKLKKQRIVKLGKRTFAKIPYTQLKRGCIYGKHGLGIRFRS